MLLYPYIAKEEKVTDWQTNGIDGKRPSSNKLENSNLYPIPSGNVKYFRVNGNFRDTAANWL